MPRPTNDQVAQALKGFAERLRVIAASIDRDSSMAMEIDEIAHDAERLSKPLTGRDDLANIELPTQLFDLTDRAVRTNRDDQFERPARTRDSDRNRIPETANHHALPHPPR